jgi:hypothetical protein
MHRPFAVVHETHVERSSSIRQAPSIFPISTYPPPLHNPQKMVDVEDASVRSRLKPTPENTMIP